MSGHEGASEHEGWLAMPAFEEMKVPVQVGTGSIETAYNHRVVLRSIPALRALRA